MVKGADYVEKGVEHYLEQLNNQKRKQLHKLALELDMQVIP